jgi:hypothetical protein
MPIKPDPYPKTYRWAASLCSSDGCSDRATGNGTHELHRDGRAARPRRNILSCTQFLPQLVVSLMAAMFS